MGSKSKKSNQKKPTSPTVKTVNVPKPEEKAEPPKPPEDANLCDTCAYEVGQCDGVPKFASDSNPDLKGADADRVVECSAWVNVESLPTAAEVKASPAAAGQEPAQDAPGPQEKAQEPKPEPKPQAVARLLPDPKRFEKKEDFGNCNTCGQALKRTALNRVVDAVRCTNGRCNAYRTIVKTLPTGVK